MVYGEFHFLATFLVVWNIVESVSVGVTKTLLYENPSSILLSFSTFSKFICNFLDCFNGLELVLKLESPWKKKTVCHQNIGIHQIINSSNKLLTNSNYRIQLFTCNFLIDIFWWFCLDGVRLSILLVIFISFSVLSARSCLRRMFSFL